MVPWDAAERGQVTCCFKTHSKAPQTLLSAAHPCCIHRVFTPPAPRSRLPQASSCALESKLRCPPHRLQPRLLFHSGLSYRHRKGNTAEEFPFLDVSSLPIVWRLDRSASPLSNSLGPLETRLQAPLIRRSSARAPLAAAGKSGRLWPLQGPILTLLSFALLMSPATNKFPMPKAGAS